MGGGIAQAYSTMGFCTFMKTVEVTRQKSGTIRIISLVIFSLTIVFIQLALNLLLRLLQTFIKKKVSQALIKVLMQLLFVNVPIGLPDLVLLGMHKKLLLKQDMVKRAWLMVSIKPWHPLLLVLCLVGTNLLKLFVLKCKVN